MWQLRRVGLRPLCPGAHTPRGRLTSGGHPQQKSQGTRRRRRAHATRDTPQYIHAQLSALRGRPLVAGLAAAWTAGVGVAHGRPSSRPSGRPSRTVIVGTGNAQTSGPLVAALTSSKGVGAQCRSCLLKLWNSLVGLPIDDCAPAPLQEGSAAVWVRTSTSAARSSVTRHRGRSAPACESSEPSLSPDTEYLIWSLVCYVLRALDPPNLVQEIIKLCRRLVTPADPTSRVSNTPS